MAKSVSFMGSARRNFPSRGLTISAGNLGRAHTFEFEDRDVRVVMPPPEKATLEFRDGPAFRVSYFISDPDNRDTALFEISEVDVWADIPQRLTIDERAFSRPPKFIGGGKVQVKKLNDAADEYAALLYRAWEHWQRIVRWVANIPSLGREASQVGSDPYGGRSAYLYRKSDGYRIWTQTTRIIGGMPGGITTAQWDIVQEVLAQQVDAPVWFDFISESLHRYATYDHRGALISSAIACETALRSLFWLCLPNVSQEAARDIIDKSPVQALLSRWADLAGLTRAEAKRWDTSSIHKLFDARNRVMHLGSAPQGRKDAWSMIAAARTFLGDLDSLLCLRAGTPDWRTIYKAAA